MVRLPVAHCELNPIEMAWAQVKGYVKDHNKKFTLSEVKRLVDEGFKIVTPERWKKLIKHVQEKIEDHYWEHDGLYEDMMERFIIQVGNDSSSSEDSSSVEDSSSSEDSSMED